MARLTGLVIAVLLGSAPAYADTYRWVDDNGVVNYSERKPRGVPAERVEVIASKRARRDAAAEPAAASNAARASLPPGTVVSRTTSSTLVRASEVDRENLTPDQVAMLEQLEQAESERMAKVEKIREDNCRRSRNVLDNLQSEGRIRLRGNDGNTRVMAEEERARRIADAQRGVVTNCNS